MRFIEQQIKGLYLIKPNTHEDNRGVFHRSYCEDELKQVGINFKVKQGNISENFNKHTLRGFHFQKPPSKESKIISCVTGALFNVVIDLRRDSKTYHQSVILSISSHIKEDYNP